MAKPSYMAPEVHSRQTLNEISTAMVFPMPSFPWAKENNAPRKSSLPCTSRGAIAGITSGLSAPENSWTTTSKLLRIRADSSR